MQKKETLGELIRFGIVGTTAAAIHYAIYWVLQHWINVNVAYTLGYFVSFLFNYYLSAHFTFREKTAAFVPDGPGLRKILAEVDEGFRRLFGFQGTGELTLDEIKKGLQ